MLKQDKEKISDKIIEIGSKINGLITLENQDIVYALLDELRELQDQVNSL